MCEKCNETAQQVLGGQTLFIRDGGGPYRPADRAELATALALTLEEGTAIRSTLFFFARAEAGIETDIGGDEFLRFANGLMDTGLEVHRMEEAIEQAGPLGILGALGVNVHGMTTQRERSYRGMD